MSKVFFFFVWSSLLGLYSVGDQVLLDLDDLLATVDDLVRVIQSSLVFFFLVRLPWGPRQVRALGTSCLVVAPLSRQKMGFSLDTWNNAKIHSDQSETYIKSTYTLTLVFLEIFNRRKRFYHLFLF